MRLRCGVGKLFSGAYDIVEWISQKQNMQGMYGGLQVHLLNTAGATVAREAASFLELCCKRAVAVLSAQPADEWVNRYMYHILPTICIPWNEVTMQKGAHGTYRDDMHPLCFLSMCGFNCRPLFLKWGVSRHRIHAIHYCVMVA
jgi:hypothetical protein